MKLAGESLRTFGKPLLDWASARKLEVDYVYKLRIATTLHNLKIPSIRGVGMALSGLVMAMSEVGGRKSS